MGRAPCCDKANVKKGPWSPEEDAKLKQYIEKNGNGGNWIALPQKAGLKRCGKSCRLRWLNYLRPNIKHGEFSDREDKIICSLFATIGSRWSIIAAQFPDRTDNDIKNYWNTKLKKKFMSIIPCHQRILFGDHHYYNHHFQASPFQSPSPLKCSNIPTTTTTYDYNPLPPLSHPPSFSLSNNNSLIAPSITTATTTSSSSPQNPETFLWSLQQQQQYQGKDESLFMFGAGKAICSSSNDGVNNYGTTWDESNINSGVGLEEYGLEEIKQQIIGNGNCSNFLSGQNKIDDLDVHDRLMYY